MAGPARHIKSARSVPGVDETALARSQDNMVHLPSRAEEAIDRQAVEQNAQFMLAQFQADEARTGAGMSGLIGKGLAEDTPEKFETFVRALQLIDASSPGAAAKILGDAGSPESFSAYFGKAATTEGAARPSPKKASGNQIPVLEDPTTYGSGWDKKLPDNTRDRGKSLLERALEETRSKEQRVAGSPEEAWAQQLKSFMAHSYMYRQIRDAQVAKLIEMGMPPEQVGKLTREQMQELVPMSFADLPNSGLAAARRGDAGNEGEQLIFGLSTRDSKLAKILNAVDGGGGEPIKLDEYFKWWRYPFPRSEGGVIVRPGFAPTGEFLARMTKHTMRLGDSHPDWVPKTTRLFDELVAEQAGTRPKSEGYRGADGDTAMDYHLNLLNAPSGKRSLEPYRGGVYLKQAEQQGWPFEQFNRDLRMWKDETPTPLGDASPGPITRGLLEESGADVMPAQPISTPEGAPPITPAGDELSMYDPRMMPPSVLAALLA